MHLATGVQAVSVDTATEISTFHLLYGSSKTKILVRKRRDKCVYLCVW